MVDRWQLAVASAGMTMAYYLRQRSTALIKGEGRRVVIITGCDSGFGRGLLAEAVRAGFVVVAAHYAETAKEAAKKEYGDLIWAVACDLTETVQPVVDAAKEALAAAAGRELWAVVNNAGMLKMGFTDLLPPAAFEKVMQLNFHAAVKLNYALLPELKKCRNSRVIATSSTAGIIALPGSGPYTASKFALEAYCDCLRIELLPWNVKVALIEPGGHKTALGQGFFDSCLQTFEEAPKERQELYGEKWMQSMVKARNKVHPGGDPADVVRAMMVALQAEQPASRYPVGADAKLVFPILRQLPDSVLDKLMMNFIYPTLPATVRKSKL